MTGSGVVRRHIVVELLFDYVTRVTSGLRLRGARRSSDSPYREISAIGGMDSSSFAKLVPCLTSEFVDNQSKCGFAPK
jgi:hypothetical protein